MKNPMQPIDLRESVQIGIEHIRSSVDRERDCHPYFRFNLVSPPIWSQHEAADTPHGVHFASASPTVFIPMIPI